MGVVSLEHRKAAYAADFGLYAAAVVALGGLVVIDAPPDQALSLAAIAAAGLGGWSLIEYLLHCFVLHGLQPFRSWHAEHHQRPTALICASTVFSVALITGLVFLPALVVGGLWRACALTLGVLSGYLSYAITHHATHHWRADNLWLRERKRWHARHHHDSLQGACFGVTSSFREHLLGSARRVASPAQQVGIE